MQHLFYIQKDYAKKKGLTKGNTSQSLSLCVDNVMPYPPLPCVLYQPLLALPTVSLRDLWWWLGHLYTISEVYTEQVTFRAFEMEFQHAQVLPDLQFWVKIQSKSLMQHQSLLKLKECLPEPIQVMLPPQLILSQKQHQ